MPAQPLHACPLEPGLARALGPPLLACLMTGLAPWLVTGVALALIPGGVSAAEGEEARQSEAAPSALAVLDTVEIRARREERDSPATSASQGHLGAERLRQLPLLRPADLLEQVPGMIVTQHAGDGKANQYFLRGFNLDHGTDFSVSVAGMPVNMPSHAHGQGYIDLNFLIPELVEGLSYRKGPYFAEDGDFSSAGAVRIDYLRRLAQPFVQQGIGTHGYARSLLAASPAWGPGHLLAALEWQQHDGPWQVPEQLRRLNAVLRYSEGSRTDGLTVTAMAYQGQWRSTDQVPQRAIDSALISRYGSLDPSDGGISRRYSLAAEWARRGRDTQDRVQAWALQSSLSLWSNFQYCLNDIARTGQCANSDQFMQAEQRQAAGLSASREQRLQWQGRETTLSFGAQARSDHLSPVGLYASRERLLLATVREDRVTQRSLALWAQADIQWSALLRTVMGLRADHYAFAVSAGLPANGGKVQDQLLSPKLGLILTPSPDWSLHLNYGAGFHSNDARGTTLTRDPAQPANSAQAVTPLVRTRGLEAGLRLQALPGWHSTLTLWQLRSASELVFVGDAGSTEPSRPSRRVGIEWSHGLQLARWWRLDADLAWSRARFVDADPQGPWVPGAVTRTAHLLLTMTPPGPWSGKLVVRHIGPRPLLEDNSLRSAGATVTSLRIGYRLGAQTDLALEVHNLFNRAFNDIEYAYLSQLAGESRPVMDRHVHPGEPRALRLTLTQRF